MCDLHEAFENIKHLLPPKEEEEMKEKTTEQFEKEFELEE